MAEGVDVPMETYRALLTEIEQKSQEDYDKAVFALSGGALGVSFAFVKDIVGEVPIQHPNWLLAAWIFWGLSVSCVLFSFFFSQMALRKAINQFDKGEIRKVERPGGWFDIATAALNVAGGVLFLAGIISMTVFASHNFGGSHGQQTKVSASAQVPTPTPTQEGTSP